jgi:hypothetical protein
VNPERSRHCNRGAGCPTATIPRGMVLALTLFVGESPTLLGAGRAPGLGVVEWSKEIGPGLSRIPADCVLGTAKRRAS